MPHHRERPAEALAKGPAKPVDIERVRRDVGTAEAEHAVGQVQQACRTISADLGALRRAVGPDIAQRTRARD